MKTFRCDHCQALVYFENVQCLVCGHVLGFLPDQACVSALQPADDELWLALAEPVAGRHYRMCHNYAREQVCNWMVAAHDNEQFCRSCRHNQTIPDLSQPQHRAAWHRLELAKRRLLYTLLNLNLPLLSKQEDPERGLAFAFLADPEVALQDSEQVVTGHAQGLITINIAEADDAYRERMRLDMNERYRTVLGHFRHEVGHYYWEQLVAQGDRLARYRQLFGDERTSYDQALRRHYEQGPTPDWQQTYISAYASSHPWEDWAESWAHYLHMVDTLETARAVDLRIQSAPLVEVFAGDDAPVPDAFDDLIESWFPLTFAINSINRSMGLKDLYPFVLCEPAIEKLRFVHHVIREAGNS